MDPIHLRKNQLDGPSREIPNTETAMSDNATIEIVAIAWRKVVNKIAGAPKIDYIFNSLII